MCDFCKVHGVRRLVVISFTCSDTQMPAPLILFHFFCESSSIRFKSELLFQDDLWQHEVLAKQHDRRRFSCTCLLIITGSPAVAKLLPHGTGSAQTRSGRYGDLAEVKELVPNPCTVVFLWAALTGEKQKISAEYLSFYKAVWIVSFI